MYAPSISMIRENYMVMYLLLVRPRQSLTYSAQLTRRLLYRKYTYHHNRTENSILIYRLSFCLFVIDVDIDINISQPCYLRYIQTSYLGTYLTYHAAAVERSHIGDG